MGQSEGTARTRLSRIPCFFTLLALQPRGLDGFWPLSPPALRTASRYAELQQALSSRSAGRIGSRLYMGPADAPYPEWPAIIRSESLYVLDGTAMLYRAFYSKTELEGYDWERPLILMGMEIGNFLKTVEPRYVAVSFDFIGDRSQNIRYAIYPKYKAHRPPRPPELMALLPMARKLVMALGLRCLEADGFEADDVMATMAVWARRRGLWAVLVTTDKDLYQCVNDSVFVLHAKTGEVIGPKEVVKKCGVRPDQARDLQSLAGDQGDNIPGVLGVGPKTAVKLLNRFEDVEGIYENIDHVCELSVYRAKQLKPRLLAQRSELDLFRRVTTLVTDVPLDGLRGLTAKDFRYRGMHYDAEEIMKAIGGFMGPLHFVKNNVVFDYY